MPANDWTLQYPGLVLPFGAYATGIMLGGPPDLGDVEIRADDDARPREDGRAFGLDYLGGRTVVFDLIVLGDGEEQTRQRVEQLGVAWRADPIRKTPGAVAELHTVNAGRPRVAYGRPRRFAAGEKATGQGVGRVVCDFVTADSCWYDPAEQQAVVGLVPPPSGGLIAPLAAPLTTVPAAESPGAIAVGGTLPAWPVITFYGPVTNPACTVTGLWTITLATTIPDGRSVTVDTRPWGLRARTVLRDDGGSFAGTLTRTSPRLRDTGVPPGTYEIAMRGVDVSGTAQMRFAWRNTYSGL